MGRQLRTRCLRWAWCPTRYAAHWRTHAQTHPNTHRLWEMIKHLHIYQAVFFFHTAWSSWPHTSVTVYLLDWCLLPQPASSYSSMSGWSTDRTDRKILCEASVCSITAEAAAVTAQAFHLNLRHVWTVSLMSYSSCPISEALPLRPPVWPALSFSLLYLDHSDVCVRPGELPGPLHGDL